jgi:hypothetical protein
MQQTNVSLVLRRCIRTQLQWNFEQKNIKYEKFIGRIVYKRNQKLFLKLFYEFKTVWYMVEKVNLGLFHYK